MKENQIFLEEEKMLNKINGIINDKLQYNLNCFDEQKNFRIGFTEGLRGTQFNRQSMMSMYATEVNAIKAIKDNPYFGRFDFIPKCEEKQIIYIGKKMIVDNEEKIIVHDWRTPICSLYYDYGVGTADYLAFGKKIIGEITEKRQIVIKNGKLVTVNKQDVVSDDSFLISYLTENNDARLKSIIATIQREQNKIIRSPFKRNYIIQGVAGSGKTTVALHRLSYLLFAESKNILPSEFMIIGPNRYFLDYISSMFPELDIKNVYQSTFDEIIKDMIKYNGKFKTKTDVLKEILDGKVAPETIHDKNTIEFTKLIEKFVNSYILKHIEKPIIYQGITICTKEYLNNIVKAIEYDRNKSKGEVLKTYIKLIKKRAKDNSENFCNEYWNKNKQKIMSLPPNSKERNEEIKKNDLIMKEFKKGCTKQIDEYFKFIKTKPLIIYQAFINSLDSKYDYIKNYTLENLKSKTISDDDLAALFVIYNELCSSAINNHISQLIIDEAQDISPAQYYVLRKMYPNSYFNIYGDMNQSIFSYQSFINWEELNEILLNGIAERLELNKTYRTTKQISDVSNLVLDKINTTKAECIARNGNDISLNYCNNKDLVTNIVSQINELKRIGNQSIAIICKDYAECLDISKNLKKYKFDIRVISEKDTNYEGNLCIIPSYDAKGLEFDAVIVSDGSKEKYRNNLIDMKLLYVVLTRAMHNIIINTTDELTHCLSGLEEKNITKQLKKEK